MRITCCYGCKDRVVGCHSTCEKYINEKAEKDNIKKKELKDTMIDQSLYHLTVNKFAAVSKSKKEV